MLSLWLAPGGKYEGYHILYEVLARTPTLGRTKEWSRAIDLRQLRVPHARSFSDCPQALERGDLQGSAVEEMSQLGGGGRGGNEARA
eukprot:scaffold870_cov268-Pinguiococcus_pyrenoidosus.AAC.25